MRIFIFSLLTKGLLYLLGVAGGESINASHGLSTQGPVAKNKVDEALRFARSNKLDTNRAVFIDMSIHSGKKRFFLCDLHSSKLLLSSLVCHGMGGNSTVASPEFSNKQGSNCTSLGKYKTGDRAYSQYGIHVHYKLHGLEASNNNAFKRIVVLHSYSPVSATEIYPEYLPMGWSLGCPVINDEVMLAMDELLKKNKRPLLLWIFQ